MSDFEVLETVLQGLLFTTVSQGFFLLFEHILLSSVTLEV